MKPNSIGIKHINYALVEETRPPFYTAMKYWGKKPHNIWAEFIKAYCPENGIILDPFAGSAISAFEAVKLGRRAIAFDLNPLTSFTIEVLSSELDENEFLNQYREIIKSITTDKIYLEHYNKTYAGRKGIVYNYRWLSDKVVKLAVETDDGKRYLIEADDDDDNRATKMQTLAIPYWYPRDKFPDSPVIKHKFIKDIGGNSFEHLWTRRNLYILAKIFNGIIQVKNRNVQLQLLSGFIQTLHLVSKMVVPRNPKSKRDFSGSWGRADYMIRQRSMEQNPLIVFQRSCEDKQGILHALQNAAATFSKKTKISDINLTRTLKAKADINYGIVDIADITRYIPDKSVDFIITDPPYAGLVPYLDLSLVWLIWLKHLNIKYNPDLASEITIKKKQIERAEYRRRLNNAFKQLHRVLKDDGYIVITFHHKKLQEWNDFVHAVKLSGFKFDKITHQYNRRSGESNVANPYGTSGADFYIRCVKHREVDFTDDTSGLEHFVLHKAIEIIALRNEPTPYTFLVSGLIPEMLQAGYMQPNEYKNEILRILNKYEGPGKIFKTTVNTKTKAGDFWWFSNPSEHIVYPDRPLQDRVEQTIISIMRLKVSVKLDDILSELFRSYPNGLTPDPRNIKSVLKKYAYESAGNWKIKPTVIHSITEHSAIISLIAQMGKKVGFKIFVGKREQPESLSDGSALKSYCDHVDLKCIKSLYKTEQLRRIEMIDLLWINSKTPTIKCVFEVENTTNFISAIQRASNIEKSIPKIMVIPDERENELHEVRDPLFVESFISNNWRFMTYSSVKRLMGFSKPNIDELLKVASSISV